MSAPTLDVPVVAEAQAPATRRSRVAVVLTVVSALAVVAGVGIAGDALLDVEPDRVPVAFGGDAQAIASDWGNEEFFGVPGSWIVVYDHGHELTMEVPWEGPPVSGAELGDPGEHLLTTTGVELRDGVLEVDVVMGNCRYFHERELDMFTSLTVLEADGDSTEVLFDRPLLVHSPMLHSCPDRTLDRGDDLRGETYRR